MTFEKGINYLITMSNNRLIFINEESIISQDAELVSLDSNKTFEIMVQPVTQNNLKIAAVKISDYIFKSKKIHLNKNSIINIDELDKENTICKTVLKEKTGLILPN